MIVHNVEQKSDEWHEARDLKMTASCASKIRVNGAGLVTYIKELVASHYSRAERFDMESADMDRGNELEDVARTLYELETGNKVETVGFIEYSQYVGCSPDGLVGEDGGIEIKCPNDKNFISILLDNEVAVKEYGDQCQMCMYVTNRNWWDIVIYNPNFEVGTLIIKRVERDQDLIDKIELGIKLGENLIKEMVDKIEKIKTQS